MKKSLIIIGVLVVLAFLYWFFVMQKSKESAPTGEQAAKLQSEQVDSSLGGALSAGVSNAQPIENIPNVNPLNRVETNPYKLGYTNPFTK